MEKIKAFWDKLPKEIKVFAYVALSGASTAVVKQLESTEVKNLLVMALVNVFIVFLRERILQIKAKLEKK